MTNYEYLRSLPLEELAKEIANFPVCDACKWRDDECDNVGYCYEVTAEWLKSERETGDW